jgi:hypothetical protein
MCTSVFACGPCNGDDDGRGGAPGGKGVEYKAPDDDSIKFAIDEDFKVIEEKCRAGGINSALLEVECVQPEQNALADRLERYVYTSLEVDHEIRNMDKKCTSIEIYGAKADLVIGAAGVLGFVVGSQAAVAIAGGSSWLGSVFAGATGAGVGGTGLGISTEELTRIKKFDLHPYIALDCYDQSKTVWVTDLHL